MSPTSSAIWSDKNAQNEKKSATYSVIGFKFTKPRQNLDL